MDRLAAAHLTRRRGSLTSPLFRGMPSNGHLLQRTVFRCLFWLVLAVCLLWGWQGSLLRAVESLVALFVHLAADRHVGRMSPHLPVDTA